jgi:hypothetical protein
VSGGSPESLRTFRTRSIGYIGTSVLLGKEDTEMYWHNPKTRTSERVDAPSDDEEAIRMLAGHPSSATFVSEYAELRHSGMPIETALITVGHEGRLRQHEYMPVRLAERERPRRRRMRPSATGYLLLLALRLREEGKTKNFLESLHPNFGEFAFHALR